jgi:hypothetical protein
MDRLGRRRRGRSRPALRRRRRSGRHGIRDELHDRVSSSIPRSASAADGSFVVAWESFGPDGSGDGIRAQRFDASGALSGTEIQMNTYTTGEQNLPSICSTSDGRFMVVWRSTDGDGAGVFGRGIGLGTRPRRFPAACASAPVGGCLGGAKASFRVKKDDDPAKNQIKWKLQKGDAFDQNVLGDPSTSRAYTLCIYDETADVPSFVTSLAIGPSPSWDDKNPKGFRYRDTSGTQDGVIKASLKTGASEKASVSVSAKGSSIPMPVPVSGSELFDLDTTVTVQLINDETSTCWTSEFTAAGMKKNDPTQFNARTRYAARALPKW